MNRQKKNKKKTKNRNKSTERKKEKKVKQKKYVPTLVLLHFWERIFLTFKLSIFFKQGGIMGLWIWIFCHYFSSPYYYEVLVIKKAEKKKKKKKEKSSSLNLHIWERERERINNRYVCGLKLLQQSTSALSRRSCICVYLKL